MSKSKQKIVILGAGLAGTLLSIFLAKRNFDVHVFERRRDLRKTNSREGRSINLTMGIRALRALQEAGIDKSIRKISIPLYRRVMHSEDGTLSRQPYGIGKQAIYSVCRFKLNRMLINIAEKLPNIQLNFQQECIDVDLNANEILLKNTVKQKEHSVKGNLIIGGDGAYSSVRSVLQKTSMFNYSQHYIDYGYKELSISSGRNNAYLLDKHGFHIWARGSYMLVASPDLQGTFTATIFLPFKGGKGSFENLSNEENVLNFFNKHFPDIVPHIPKLAEQFFSEKPATMINVKCSPWIHENKILLLGDSAHAIPPFYGQGMNAAFEDCRTFVELLDKYENNFDEVLPKFQQERIPNTDALSELTLHNFVEIRDHVAKSGFLFRKKIEAKIQEQYPDKWQPLYTMVAFTHTPYAEALARGKKQKAIIDQVMDLVDIEKNWQKIDYGTLINFDNLTWKATPITHEEYW